MIRVVDYGVGNVQAFINMFKQLGLPAGRATVAADLADATHLILPGVGAFDPAMSLLNRSGMREPMEAMVLGRGVPVLGVCLGMQMLATSSEEGELPGLNWVPGRVRAFASDRASSGLPLPHMGWNDLRVRPGATLFAGLHSAPRYYFLHSYFFECDDGNDTVATAHYGLDFSCAVARGNIHGLQCHPEKSHHWGAKLLENFGRLPAHSFAG